MRLVSQSIKRLLYVNQAGNWLQLRCKTLSHNKTITIDLWTHTQTHRRIILTTLMLFGWQELVGCQLVVVAASLSLSFSFPLESPAQPLTHCIGMATATTTPAFIFFFFFVAHAPDLMPASASAPQPPAAAYPLHWPPVDCQINLSEITDSCLQPKHTNMAQAAAARPGSKPTQQQTSSSSSSCHDKKIYVVRTRKTTKYVAYKIAIGQQKKGKEKVLPGV